MAIGMRDHTLLVVDDDALVIDSVKLAVPAPWRTLACRGPTPLPERGFAAALVDMHLSDRADATEGLEVIRHLRRARPDLEIIAMSGDLDRQLMEQCLRAGATRFLAKPLNLDEVRLTLVKIEALLHLRGIANRQVLNKISWIGAGAASRRVLGQIAQLRDEGGPILIEGESGTGKEVCAQLIHAQQSAGPLVAINVAAIPENLFESELFGHLKGAFTGADQNKVGLIEAANGGDLFLDEVEALSLPLQAKLLRFLETGEIRRVGGRDVITVRTRVIAASNRDLSVMVSENKFREDLWWRLGGHRVTLPPLRERSEDIPELARYFLARDPARRKELAPDAVAALLDYHWPGNVRELKRICERLTLSAPLPLVRREDVVRLIRVRVASASPAQIDLHRGLADLVNEFEGHLIKRALDDQGDIDGVARTLKISRSSLYKKIKDHDLSPYPNRPGRGVGG